MMVKDILSHKLLVLGLALFISGSLQAQEGIKSFSLEDCIEYALENNTDIKNAAIDQQIAKEQVEQTIATGLPQISGSGDLGYNFRIRQAIVPARTFDPSAPEDLEVALSFGMPYTGSLAAGLNQMVFNGSYFVGLKAAKTFRELSRKDWIKTKIDTKAAVMKAYYNYLINREMLQLVNQNYERLDSLLDDTRVMYETGFVEKIDVNRLQVQLNNLKSQKTNVENMFTISKQLLKFQMGMPLDEDIEIKGSLEEIEFQEVAQGFASEFEISDRIEYNILQVNRELVELDIANVQNQYLPQLYIYGNAGYNNGRQEMERLFNQSWFSFGTVGLQLQVPIFDGFLKKNQIEEKRLELKKISNGFDQLENSIKLEIDQSSLTYDQSVENMVAQYENMEMAKEVYEVAKIKYEEGVGSNREVLDAETALEESQTNYYAALFDALTAKVDLLRAYGKLDHDLN